MKITWYVSNISFVIIDFISGIIYIQNRNTTWIIDIIIPFLSNNFISFTNIKPRWGQYAIYSRNCLWWNLSIILMFKRYVYQYISVIWSNKFTSFIVFDSFYFLKWTLPFSLYFFHTFGWWLQPFKLYSWFLQDQLQWYFFLFSFLFNIFIY